MFQLFIVLSIDESKEDVNEFSSPSTERRLSVEINLLLLQRTAKGRPLSNVAFLF